MDGGDLPVSGSGGKGESRAVRLWEDSPYQGGTEQSGCPLTVSRLAPLACVLACPSQAQSYIDIVDREMGDQKGTSMKFMGIQEHQMKNKTKTHPVLS